MIFKNEEIEIQTLGTLIGDPVIAKRYANQLTPDDFTSDSLSEIFAVVQYMQEQNMKMDATLIASIGSDQKRRFNDSHLLDVMSEYTSDIDSSIKMLKDYSGRRNLDSFLRSLLMEFETSDFVELKKKLSDGLASIDSGLALKPYRTNREIVESMSKRIEQIQSGELQIKGLTGIRNVDKIATIEGGDFVTIGAGSGVGKSWMANTISCYQSQKYGSKVLVFSMEMVDVQWAARSMSYYSGVSSLDIRNAKIDLKSELFEKAKREFIHSSITICDKPFLSFEDVRNISTIHSMDHGLDMIIVDHGLLMKMDKSKGMNYSDKIGIVTSGLKALAKELDITVVMLWQLTKDQIRGVGIPSLSKLKSSGSVIQDSDMIMMLHRPEQSGIEFENQINIGGNNYPLENLGIVSIQKNRNGLDGYEIPVKFDANLGGFVDQDEQFKKAQDHSRGMPVVQNPDPIAEQRPDTNDVPF